MSIRPGQKLPDTVEELDGVARSAVLLLLLEPDAAGAILRELPTDSVEEVTRALASLGDVPRNLGEGIISEFYSLAMAQGWAREGGLDYAKRLIKDSLDGGVADKVGPSVYNV